jgi:hypothetical protein
MRVLVVLVLIFRLLAQPVHDVPVYAVVARVQHSVVKPATCVSFVVRQDPCCCWGYNPVYLLGCVAPEG